MKKYYYDYKTFLKDIKLLQKEIKNYNPDTLLAIARGGLTIGHFLAISLNTRRLFTLNSIHYKDDLKLDTLKIFNIPDLNDAKRVVILDDIADSGETLQGIIDKIQKKYPHIDFKVATIFYKPSSIIQPDFTIREAKGWIDFFWEVDPIF